MAASKDSKLKVYSLAEVEEHNAKDDLWFAISDKVYNVSKFLDEHPGGEEVLIEQAGKDATEQFEDVGHSSDAREMMSDYVIGELREEDRKSNKVRTDRFSWGTAGPNENKSTISALLIPVGLALVASVAYKFYFQRS